MNSLQHLIPKDKADLSTIEALNHCRSAEIKQIAKGLLYWVQDGNWPVAAPIGQLLASHVSALKEELLSMLRDEDDPNGKYHSICVVFGHVAGNYLEEDIVAELTRIATNPTVGEQREEVDEAAQDVLDRWRKQAS
jgi:Domain of unknown function (DUF5071)